MTEIPIVSGGVVIQIPGSAPLTVDPLTVVFTSPIDQQVLQLRATTTVQVIASSDSAQIRFYMDGLRIKSAWSTQLSYRWRPKRIGPYQLRAVALDGQGGIGTALTITVFVESVQAL